MNTYQYMAHYVAAKLKIRPSEILDTWGVPELIVTFGQYANEESYRQYREYQAMPAESRAKVKERPKEYVLEFRTLENIEEL